MTIPWSELANPPATLGFSVNNLARKFGTPYTKAHLYAAWIAHLTAHDTPVESRPPSSAVDDGVTYLVGRGLATYNAGTDTITFLNLDSEGKPARLHRVPSDGINVELLPNGAASESV